MWKSKVLEDRASMRGWDLPTKPTCGFFRIWAQMLSYLYVISNREIFGRLLQNFATKGVFGSKLLNFSSLIHMSNSRIKHELIVDPITKMTAN